MPLWATAPTTTLTLTVTPPAAIVRPTWGIALNGDDEIVASYVAETVRGPVTAFYKANKTVTVDGTRIHH